MSVIGVRLFPAIVIKFSFSVVWMKTWVQSMASTVCEILQVQSLLNNSVAVSIWLWGNFMKFEDIRTISSEKSCVIWNHYNWFANKFWKYYEKSFLSLNAKVQHQHVFLLVLLSANLCLVFLNLVEQKQPVFQNLHHSYENLASTWFEIL